jgi:hypothetical protein
MTEFKQGIVREVEKVKAGNEGRDSYYKVKVERKDGSHFFVKLLVGSIPPSVAAESEMTKFPRVELKGEAKGVKFYEEIAEPTKGNVTSVTKEGISKHETVDEAAEILGVEVDGVNKDGKSQDPPTDEERKEAFKEKVSSMKIEDPDPVSLMLTAATLYSHFDGHSGLAVEAARDIWQEICKK